MMSNMNLLSKQVADVENLRIEPVVELHIVEALYAKFQAIIRGYCDISLYQDTDSKFASRGLIKRVSDIVWNTLAKSQYKDRAHLQTIYSYLTCSKLDCFGVAMTVLAGCQVLGFSDVHLSLSEDHAWVVFGEGGTSTAEVTWHGKGNEDKRGLPVDGERVRDSWLYVGGRPVVCSRHMEVAALVSSINPAMTPAMDCLEVGVLQQELLWLLYDLGHLESYPMALGNLGDLEEVSASPGRPTSQDLYHEAVLAGQRQYGDHHIYPYTYLAGYHYRQHNYRAALKSWADAANVIKRYDETFFFKFLLMLFSTGTSTLKMMKRFTRSLWRLTTISSHIFSKLMVRRKSFHEIDSCFADKLAHDPLCFGSLLQFYDGLCSWEEDSSTPVLHIGWVKPIVKSFAAFEFSVRSKLDITILEEEGKAELLSYSDWSLADKLNNNCKDSVNDCDRGCDTKAGHYDIALYKEEDFIYATKPPSATFEDFRKMHVNRLLRLAALDHSPGANHNLLNLFIEKAGERLFNIDFLLGNLDREPFLKLASMGELSALVPPSSRLTFPSTKAALLAEAGPPGGAACHRLPGASSGQDGRVKVTLFSSKIGDLKPLLQCEKLNSSALHLHLTAQSQTEVKKSRCSFEAEISSSGSSRVKRQRRE